MKKIVCSIIAVCILSAIGCVNLPAVQPYPYKDPAAITAQAQQISDTLEAYIKDWIAGRVPALIPESALPPGIYVDENDPNKNYNTQTESLTKNLKLVNPSSVTPADYTYIRKAHVIDQNYLYGQFPDCHYTYLHTYYLAPFGSKTIMKGKFPKCRLFLVNPTTSLNGRQYYFAAFGPQENPLIDVDIVPDSGSVNPFLVGANRNATNRNYTIEFQNKIADVGTCPAQYAPKPPYFRAPGNIRYASGILPKGPGFWGPPAGYDMLWGGGAIWMRYVLPDNYGKPGWDYLASAGIPSIEQQLSTGEKFLIITDMTAKKAFFDHRYYALTKNNVPPDSLATEGWYKAFGILVSVVNGLFRENGMTDPNNKTYCRDLIRGIEGRGATMPAPGNWEGSATCLNYCTYNNRGMKCEQGKVVVVSGKLPTFPKTVNGEATMTGAEMRYWSICTNESAWDSNTDRQPGILTSSVCDSDLVLNANREYVICYSRIADRPVNATSANGVTWVNWGENSDTHFTWRWDNVYPDWFFSKTPSEDRLTWAKTDWAQKTYDPNLLGQNTRTGWLGQYHPKVGYMTKGKFESMGGPVTFAKIDAISWNACGTSLADGSGKSIIILIPLLVSMFSLIARSFRKNKSARL